jgi:hypothetical protein
LLDDILKDMNRYLLLFGITVLALNAAFLLVYSLDTIQDISGQQTGNRTGMIANETQPFNISRSTKAIPED